MFYCYSEFIPKLKRPICPNCGIVSTVEISITLKCYCPFWLFIHRFHGRITKGHYWYNYLYSEEELKPWAEKVKQIRKHTKILRIYFNNHYVGKAVVNAMQFREMNRISRFVINYNIKAFISLLSQNEYFLHAANK